MARDKAKKTTGQTGKTPASGSGRITRQTSKTASTPKAPATFAAAKRAAKAAKKKVEEDVSSEEEADVPNNDQEELQPLDDLEGAEQENTPVDLFAGLDEDDEEQGNLEGDRILDPGVSTVKVVWGEETLEMEVWDPVRHSLHMPEVEVDDPAGLLVFYPPESFWEGKPKEVYANIPDNVLLSDVALYAVVRHERGKTRGKKWKLDFDNAGHIRPTRPRCGPPPMVLYEDSIRLLSYRGSYTITGSSIRNTPTRQTGLLSYSAGKLDVEPFLSYGPIIAQGAAAATPSPLFILRGSGAPVPLHYAWDSKEATREQYESHYAIVSSPVNYEDEWYLAPEAVKDIKAEDSDEEASSKRDQPTNIDAQQDDSDVEAESLEPTVRSGLEVPSAVNHYLEGEKYRQQPQLRRPSKHVHIGSVSHALKTANPHGLLPATTLASSSGPDNNLKHSAMLLPAPLETDEDIYNSESEALRRGGPGVSESGWSVYIPGRNPRDEAPDMEKDETEVQQYIHKFKGHRRDQVEAATKKYAKHYGFPKDWQRSKDYEKDQLTRATILNQRDFRVDQQVAESIYTNVMSAVQELEASLPRTIQSPEVEYSIGLIKSAIGRLPGIQPMKLLVRHAAQAAEMMRGPRANLIDVSDAIYQIANLTAAETVFFPASANEKLHDELSLELMPVFEGTRREDAKVQRQQERDARRQPGASSYSEANTLAEGTEGQPESVHSIIEADEEAQKPSTHGEETGEVAGDVLDSSLGHRRLVLVDVRSRKYVRADGPEDTATIVAEKKAGKFYTADNQPWVSCYGNLLLASVGGRYYGRYLVVKVDKDGKIDQDDREKQMFSRRFFTRQGEPYDDEEDGTKRLDFVDEYSGRCVLVSSKDGTRGIALDRKAAIEKKEFYTANGSVWKASKEAILVPVAKGADRWVYARLDRDGETIKDDVERAVRGGDMYTGKGVKVPELDADTPRPRLPSAPSTPGSQGQPAGVSPNLNLARTQKSSPSSQTAVSQQSEFTNRFLSVPQVQPSCQIDGTKERKADEVFTAAKRLQTVQGHKPTPGSGQGTPQPQANLPSPAPGAMKRWDPNLKKLV